MAFRKMKKLVHGKRLEKTKPLTNHAKLEWSGTSAMELMRSKKHGKK